VNRFLLHGSVALLVLAGSVSCSSPEPPIEPEEPRLRRLTEAQYVNSIQDVFGSSVFVPIDNEPDDRRRGFLSVGASTASVSPRGVERFEQAAFTVAEQLMEPGLREQVLECEPSLETSDSCIDDEVERLGRFLWRRPLTSEETESVAAIARTAGQTLADPWDGFEFALAALLQSPYFLYRVELGSGGATEEYQRSFDDWELASRLSFLLWNSTPDHELLDAAEAGELSTAAGLDLQVERLLASPRARDGMKAWFGDLMRLADLADLYKDSNVFLHMSDSLGDSASEETLRFFEHLAFDEEGDLRDLATSRTTYVNREMAALYEVRAPERDGFGLLEFPSDSPRQGLLGQASFLLQASHPVSTSPTLRGKFVREVILCQTISPPLAEVDTSIPPVTEEALTLRDRVAQHLNDSGCAGCHNPMDNIGLGLENFDGIGRYRTHDNGGLIDSSGRVDEDEFTDPTELAALLRQHDDFAACLVKSFVRYANGVGEEEPQFDGLDWLAYEQGLNNNKLDSLVRTYVGSAFFKQAGPLEEMGVLSGDDDDDSGAER